MKISRPKMWIAAGVIVGLYVVSGWFDRGPTPMPGDPTFMHSYEQGGYDPAWYGEYGAEGQPSNSPISGYGATGVEVFNNPDATDWQDMVFIRD